MKIAMEHYASGALAVLMAIVVITFVFGRVNASDSPLILVMGEAIDVSLDKEEWKKKSGITFSDHQDEILPNIELRSSVELFAGENTSINTILDATDYESQVLTVRITKVWNENFQELLEGISTDSDTIRVENPGIYWMLAETVDGNGKHRQRVVKLFVNER